MGSPHGGIVMRIGLPWDLIIMYDVVSVCAAVVIVYLKPIPCSWICRDHFVYVPSQWETTLHCNVVSHWLGAYTERSPMCTSVWLCLHGVHRYLYILLHHYFVIWTPGICTLNKQHPYPCMSTLSGQFPSFLWSAVVLSVDTCMLVEVSHWKLTTDPWENKWSPWAHRELTVTTVVTASGPNDHGSVTARRGHSSVTARSQLSHG